MKLNQTKPNQIKPNHKKNICIWPRTSLLPRLSQCHSVVLFSFLNTFLEIIIFHVYTFSPWFHSCTSSNLTFSCCSTFTFQQGLHISSTELIQNFWRKSLFCLNHGRENGNCCWISSTDLTVKSLVCLVTILSYFFNK